MDERGTRKAQDERQLKRVSGSCRIPRAVPLSARKSLLNQSVSADCLSRLPHDLSREIPLTKKQSSFRCVKCPLQNHHHQPNQDQGTCSTCCEGNSYPPSPMYNSTDNISSSLDDTESEYYPMSHSSSSWTELINLGKEDCSLSPQRSIDQSFSSEDELSLYNPYHYQQTYGNGLKFQMEYFQRHSPLPAAGNDNNPGASSSGRSLSSSVDQSPADSPGTSPTPDALASMPAALRRVKSMVMDGGLVDCVTPKPSPSQMATMRSHSPLISDEDAVSLDMKITPRVASSSTKFSLRRSASNISVRMTPFKRGGVPLVKPCIPISEEGDETAESSEE